MRLNTKEIQYYKSILQCYDYEINFLKKKIKKLKKHKILSDAIRVSNDLFHLKAKHELEYGSSSKEYYIASYNYEEAKNNVRNIKEYLGIKDFIKLSINLENYKEEIIKEIKNNLGEVQYYLSTLIKDTFRNEPFFAKKGVYIWLNSYNHVYFLYDYFNYNSTEFFEEIMKYLPYKNDCSFTLYGVKDRRLLIKDGIYTLYDTVNFKHYSTDSVQELFAEIRRIIDEYTE